MVPLFLLLFISQVFADAPSCDSKVFCQGKLLHTVQMAKINPDSKTFVDMKLKADEATTLANFDKLMADTKEKPSPDQIKKFVADNFDEGAELEDFTPTDYTPNPEIIDRIIDSDDKAFIKDLVPLWLKLAKKVKTEVIKDSSKYTIIPVDNGFVVPGGRFREFYYWDSFWIIQGLLACDMYATAAGMIKNYVAIVNKYGFLPNGARIYYLNRSQPPLLTLMVSKYMEKTNDMSMLQTALPVLLKEMNYWYTHKTVKVKKDNAEYTVYRYNVDSGSPRPESYYEDFTTASGYPDEEAKKQLYSDLKSAAESGWDFSSKWSCDEKGGNNGSLISTRTRRIIPVELNAYMAQSCAIISGFYKLLKDENNAKVWNDRALAANERIQKMFWDNDDGTWYDWDSELGKPRKFFYPSNFAPLFAKAYDPKSGEFLGKRAAEYIDKMKIMDYKGGVPTSLLKSGQQWDLPNAWPPLQSLVIFGLQATGQDKAMAIAKELAARVFASFKMGFRKHKEMFEKYDAVNQGEYGGGGEYTVQPGFGWSNGVAFEIAEAFYTKPKAKAGGKDKDKGQGGDSKGKGEGGDSKGKGEGGSSKGKGDDGKGKNGDGKDKDGKGKGKPKRR